MKILITAGGTSEKIDEVRKITNTASGRLGALIAEEFVSKAGAGITFVCSASAVTPEGAGIDIVRTGSVSDLMNTITTLLKQNKFDAVIHSMAVSDYSVRGVIAVNDLVSSVAEAVSTSRDSLEDYDSLINIINSSITQKLSGSGEQKKISSDIDNPILFMEKTPKIIKIIKQLQPKTILVGFKLLVDVTENALLNIGHGLLTRNDCDFVLANDLNNIQKDNHIGILIRPDSSYIRLYSKQEIAEAVTDGVIAKIRGAK